MKMITEPQIKIIYSHSTEVNRRKYLPYINEYLTTYHMDERNVVCAFLAQIGHESGQFRYVEELASGSAYEGRKDLGNTQAGDGKRYKGRGLIQITGKANYTELSKDLEVDFVANPTLLQEPQYAVQSAFWYWEKRNLNRYCTNKIDDFKTLTRRINGGLNGYADRLALWTKAKEVLSTLSNS